MTRLLRLPAVEAACGLKRSEIYKRIKRGAFPSPIKLGRASAFIEAEILGWIDRQIRATRDRGHSMSAPIAAWAESLVRGGDER